MTISSVGQYADGNEDSKLGVKHSGMCENLEKERQENKSSSSFTLSIHSCHVSTGETPMRDV